MCPDRSLTSLFIHYITYFHVSCSGIQIHKTLWGSVKYLKTQNAIIGILAVGQQVFAKPSITSPMFSCTNPNMASWFLILLYSLCPFFALPLHSFSYNFDGIHVSDFLSFVFFTCLTLYVLHFASTLIVCFLLHLFCSSHFHRCVFLSL